MGNLEEYNKLIELEKKYRLKYAGVEDLEERERYYIDKEIFPDWWFASLDNTLKIELISKALENNEKLLDLDEVIVINKNIINRGLNENIYTE